MDVEFYEDVPEAGEKQAHLNIWYEATQVPREGDTIRFSVEHNGVQSVRKFQVMEVLWVSEQVVNVRCKDLVKAAITADRLKRRLSAAGRRP